VVHLGCITAAWCTWGASLLRGAPGVHHCCVVHLGCITGCVVHLGAMMWCTWGAMMWVHLGCHDVVAPGVP